MTRELDFPIELRHPDGGTLLFTSMEAVIEKFFGNKITHLGFTVWPCEFLLYVNGRHYNWSRECIAFPEDPGFTWDKARELYKGHLQYVVEIEEAFYDVNTGYEDKVPENS